MIGLPSPSLALGIRSVERPADPTEQYWLAPLLHVLAEKASYRPYMFFDGDDELRDAVVAVAGYDLDRPAELPRPLAGAKPQGLRRLIYYAWFYKRGDVARPAPTPLTVKDAKGRWGLTEAGVSVAVGLRPEFATDGRNVTNVWLNGQIESNDLYNRLVRSLTYDPTISKEREAGEVHDHVDHFLGAKIRTNAFATRLATCDAPTYREVKKYCLRATYTTFKRRAQDALHRETRGALTDTERENGGPGPEAMVASSYARVMQTTDCIRSEAMVTSEVFVDNDATERTIHMVEFERGMDKVRDAFRRHKPGNHKRIERIFNFMAEGRSVADIGKLEGVSRNRAASLMADTRQALRDARVASTDATPVLKYIDENPRATNSDIANDIAVAGDLSVLLKGLVEAGRLEAKPKPNPKVKPCRTSVVGYTITDRGRGLLADHVSDATPVLEYIDENPWSTNADITDDITVAGNLLVLLKGLVKAGGLEAKTFKAFKTRRGSVVGFTITDRGRGFLADRVSDAPVSTGLIESICL